MGIAREETIFADASIFIPEIYPDDRGFFKETYSTQKYGALGLHDAFVQDSVSFSKRGVVRGLHYDLKMSKFVQVLRGEIWDAIVDVRRDSPTFLRWQGFELSERNHKQLYIPAGFAHGFVALTDDVVFSYKHGALYDPSSEGAIRYDDPHLAIAWPRPSEPLVSAKDRAAPLLAASPFAP